MTGETKAQRSIPVALTIAGSDSSAGAGIQADLKTFTALGVYGLTAVTCVVAEIPGKVSRIEALSPAIVREQIEVLARGFPIAAIKTGLLCSANIVRAVAEALAEFTRKIDIVVDPVMIATGGDELLEPNAVEACEKELFPCATLITPNMDEAARLLGTKIEDRSAMEHGARALSERYGTAVLLKGGHLLGANAIDLLCAKENITEFAAPFVRGVTTHGTGCTYSAAIAAGLARSLPLEKSIRLAKDFVTASIERYRAWGDVHALNHSPPG